MYQRTYPGIPAVAKVSAVDIAPTVVDVLSSTSISNFSGVPAVAVIPTVACFSSVVNIPQIMLFPSILASLLLVSPDVLVVSCLCRAFC